MKAALARLRDKLGADAEYFQQVYNYTFEFSRPAGQRSLAGDMAQGFWALLIPHGLQGGALAHVASGDDDEDDDMGEEEGWRDEFTQWWFDFLTEKGGKGISKDTWQMVRRLHLCMQREPRSDILSPRRSSSSSCAPSTRDLRSTTRKLRGRRPSTISCNMREDGWRRDLHDDVAYQYCCLVGHNSCCYTLCCINLY
ncbi:Cullin binding-domain-containing protein [Amylocystis lapponica]|nr:Cullin binding-domain-containing protein [Amylocystis lapponica]